MALSQVRIQLLDAVTGEVIKEVDVLTSPGSVIFEDGQTLLDKISEIQKAEGPKGETGTRGSQWYQGTGITGTSTTATAFPESGVAAALVNDNYLNTDTGATYVCTVAGNASTAKWAYKGSIKGVKGDTGATGAKGDTGLQGPKGDPGTAGAKGETGATGPKGDTGEQGPKGETGATGPKGDIGATGPAGADGDKVKFGTTYATATEVKLFMKQV